jgi:hypothetical protein
MPPPPVITQQEAGVLVGAGISFTVSEIVDASTNRDVDVLIHIAKAIAAAIGGGE